MILTRHGSLELVSKRVPRYGRFRTRLQITGDVLAALLHRRAADLLGARVAHVARVTLTLAAVAPKSAPAWTEQAESCGTSKRCLCWVAPKTTAPDCTEHAGFRRTSKRRPWVGPTTTACPFVERASIRLTAEKRPLSVGSKKLTDPDIA